MGRIVVLQNNNDFVTDNLLEKLCLREDYGELNGICADSKGELKGNVVAKILPNGGTNGINNN